jgi:hypothetical protein
VNRARFSTAWALIQSAEQQFWVPMTRRHPDLEQRRFIHEAEPIARPTGHGPIHLAKRIFNWRFASGSCELSSFTRITQPGMVGVADAFPSGVFEGVVQDQQASHCPSDKAEDEG